MNPRNSKPRTVLVLGSGALQIGQAGEFDYSGSQALKALREEGVRTILLNPNIATVQTSHELADEVYFLPVELPFVAKVIEREKVDGILLSFGGQTALNCGLALDDAGILTQNKVRVLGTPTSAIRATEDRALFNTILAEIDVKVARSLYATTVPDVIDAGRTIGLPVVLRASFSLGGKGAAIAHTERDLAQLAAHALRGAAGVLVEECLSGWKEIEYEVVRDAANNAITVCNMENVDPMGIHTGESIVVAPAQTLDDADHQLLRNIALRTIRRLGIIGECNIQYALSPNSRDYRVIEVNARLSRSSALASKATGYPLAYVAAKIALGYELPEIPNGVTKVTTAFFEPALDYVVCKLPRWDFAKFEGSTDRIGPEMKSVGEVMAIGRTFCEALQKGLRMLETGAAGLDTEAFKFDDDLIHELQHPSSRRILAVATALANGMSIDDVHKHTRIDAFFLGEIAEACAIAHEIAEGRVMPLAALMRKAKRAGFADRQIAKLCGAKETDVREARHLNKIRPMLASIDTLAGEYPAQTAYMYLTYGSAESEAPKDIAGAVMVLGSGCYRIGSSVEFDWSCVGTLRAIRQTGRRTIVINNNPETVSTDYDVCDLLVFDELSPETVMESIDALRPLGVVVSVGGQTANNLARTLAAANIRVFGTSAESIDTAEDRQKFSALCDRLGIAQPMWLAYDSADHVDGAVASVGGFPVIVRPSYVLSGAAMRVAHGHAELRDFLESAAKVSPEHPVVISKFEEDCRELEVDAVAKDGVVLHWAITEHVENAGVHSGDATLVLPPQRLFTETVRRARRIVDSLARALHVTGPFNVQMLGRDNDVKVIECNLRASRSLPFVSKSLGVDFVREAANALLDVESEIAPKDPLNPNHVAVKSSQFSFRRIDGVDPALRVEMTSTGEVGCFGRTFEEALMKAMLSVGFRYPRRGVLLSLGPIQTKYKFSRQAQLLLELGLPLYATAQTADALKVDGRVCTRVSKGEDVVDGPSALHLMRAGKIDFVINVAREYDAHGRPDGALIRRLAIDLEIPLVTDLALARALVAAIATCTPEQLEVLPWRAYVS